MTDPQSLITIATPPEPDSPPSDVQAPKRGRKPVDIPDETRTQILHLHGFYSARQISPRVGMSRKLVERVLREHGLAPCPRSTDQVSPDIEDGSKLDPFQQLVTERVRQHLTTTRILREIRQVGYQGGRTILGAYVRQVRSELELEPRKSVKRRFETAPAEEIQVDWSPYQVVIGGRLTKIHVLGCLLAWSRKLYAWAFRDERQSTLLEGLACAFAYFDGVAARLVVDNMATAVLGRIGPENKVLWHPRFLEFTRHYGTVPFACRVRDPNRKGKKEKSFRLVEDDFIRGSEFSCLDELNERLRLWLDDTPGCGNLRVHGTTRRVPNEAFEHEQPLLIRLAEQRFAVCEQTVRVVDADSTVSIRGTTYSVPATLAHRSVAVHLFAEHFEILDPHGRVAFSRRYVPEQDKGRLVIDPTHYASLPRKPRRYGHGERLDEAFARRFPELAPLVGGIKQHMKTLAPIHIHALLRLCELYGEDALLVAARRAQEFRRFDASAVKRILERLHPGVCELTDSVMPLSGQGPDVLGEVEAGSLESFARLDAAGPSSPNTMGDPDGSQ
jgi:transposase